MVLDSARSPFHAATVAALLIIPLSSAVHAQPPSLAQSAGGAAIGFQGGVSIDPEQVYGGVFWQSPPLGGRIHLRPGIDGGSGSDRRVAAINIDFVARFPLGNSGWHLVQGGGPVIVITRIPAHDVSDTSAGGSYVIGFSHDQGFFTEFRIGGGNVPNLKFGAGYQVAF